MTEHEKDVQRRRKAANLKEGVIAEIAIELEKEGDHERISEPDQGDHAESESH